MMKSLTNYILEYRTTDEICIYKGNDKVNPIRYAYDNESLDELVNFYKTDCNYTIKLCHLNGTKWKILKQDGIFNLNKINAEYYQQGKMSFTYDELCDNLSNGKYILILLNK